MDTEALRLFVRAAERLNISAAGRDLGLAPAVASARLAKLEREVGAELLHRSTRKVAVSIEGAEFLPFAREILAQHDAAMAALGHGKAQPEGTIRFAASSTFAQLICTALPEFSRAIGSASRSVVFGYAVDLLEGSFDLALRNSVLDDSSWRANWPMSRACYLRPTILRHGTPQVPADLERHHRMAFRSLRTRTLVSASGERAEFSCGDHNCRVIIDDGASMRCGGGAGHFHACRLEHRPRVARWVAGRVPEWHVEDDTALWLVYKTNVLTAKVRVLIDFLVEKIGRHPLGIQRRRAQRLTSMPTVLPSCRPRGHPGDPRTGFQRG